MDSFFATWSRVDKKRPQVDKKDLISYLKPQSPSNPNVGTGFLGLMNTRNRVFVVNSLLEDYWCPCMKFYEGYLPKGYWCPRMNYEEKLS